LLHYQRLTAQPNRAPSVTAQLESERQVSGRVPVHTAGKRSLLTILGTLGVAGVGALLLAVALVWFGFYDVAASTKHSTPIEWLLHFVMQRSVAAHAPELQVPNLDDPILILRGALHYSRGCAACHGAPGQLASPIAQQMTPVPPALYGAWKDFDPSQLFWIIQNGVKLTAMPAWPAPQRSDEIWVMVAFVEHLRDLTTPDYAALVGNTRSSWLPAPAPATRSGFDVTACARCHGADGRGRSGVAPALVGQMEPDLESALRAYRDGSRPSGFMQPVAAQLTDAEVIAAARYYAALGTTP
jgi:cytochrome c553